MGKMSGLDVIRTLTSRSNSVQLPAIVACTSYVTAEDQLQYQKLGFRGLLGKPFALSDLKACLIGCVSNESPFVCTVSY
jgi:CheY-like chemotaxis protein